MVMTVEEEEGVGCGRGVGISGGGDKARSMALRNMMTKRVISRGKRTVESAMCDAAILLINDIGDDCPPPPSSSSLPGNGDDDGKRRRDGKYDERSQCAKRSLLPRGYLWLILFLDVDTCHRDARANDDDDDDINNGSYISRRFNEHV